MRAKGPKPIRTLANADDIIRVLALEGELSPTQIAELLDLPRPSVYRLLDGLSAIDFTEPVRDSKARLSLRWLSMADRARESMREWRGARELLAEAMERTSQTAYLAVPRDGEAMCIDWCQGREIGVLLFKRGRSLPLHAGAAGRVMLGFDGRLEEYLAEHPSRRAYTTRTLTGEAELRADVAATRGRGYAISEGDVSDGITALAVPVIDAAGALRGSLSLSGLAEDFEGRVEEFHEVVADVGERLGALAGL